MSIIVQSATDSNKASNMPEKAEAALKTSVSADKSESEDIASDETVDASDASSEENETDADESVDQESADDEKAPVKKSGFKRRVDKLNARISKKDQEIEYWKAEALKQKTQESKAPTSDQSKKIDVTGRPSSQDFETHEDFIDAYTDWKVEQREIAKEKKAKEQQAKTSFEAKAETFKKNVKEFRDSRDDFDEVLESVENDPCSMAVEDLILSSENGPELYYELIKQKDEYKRINSLAPLEAAREFGKFEAKILKSSSEGDDSKSELKTTKAPAPIKPVSTKNDKTVKKSIYDPSLSQSEYEALRSAEINKKR